MPTTAAGDSRARVPDAYVAIPISPGQAAVPVRLCVLVRKEPDPVGGRLVVLRDLVDARVYLGCLADAAGVVHRWLEVWVQSPDHILDTLSAYRDRLTNKALDERWRRQVAAFDQMDPEALVRTGWENDHPLPVYLDLTTLEPVNPVDPVTEAPWRLCEDDALLEAKGLPPFSTSLHRYLYLPEEGEKGILVPATPDAPTNENTRSPEDALRDYREMVPLNPCGGLMLVRSFSPLGYEAFVEVLSGGSWEGLLHGRTAVPAGVSPYELNEADPALPLGGRLFLGQHGRWGRIVETFHLKLRLLADAVAAVRATVEAHQRPLLNVGAESFQVELGRPGRGLPFLWTARCVLADPGEAIALPLAASDASYYLRAGSPATSVYRPEAAGTPTRGTGTVRIREVVLGSRDQTIVEGTFETQERIEAGHMDLLWLRVNAAEQRLDLYAHIDPESALATGEIRFRTVGQKLPEETIAALKTAAGVPLQNTPFEIIPLLSSPCDLYSLGVLAVRTLLVDKDTKLPKALDEMLSLARQVAVDYDGQTPLAERIERLFETDKRWVISLGPQRLTHDQVAPEDAFDLVPRQVWWDTLAAIVRMFPGIGPDSTARDLGDAPPGGLHKVFDQALADLDALLLRTRSLIVIDWRFNREVHAVIRNFAVTRKSESRESAPS